MKKILILVVFLVGCAGQRPYYIMPPSAFRPQTVERAVPDTVSKAVPDTVKASPTTQAATRELPLTSLYGDPSLGYVENSTENKFLKCWWLPQACGNRRAVPGRNPDFELAPGFLREFRLRPDQKHWLYIEAYYYSALGVHRTKPSWRTFEIYTSTTVGYDGWYGWRLEISDW